MTRSRRAALFLLSGSVLLAACAKQDRPSEPKPQPSEPPAAAPKPEGPPAAPTPDDPPASAERPATTPAADTASIARANNTFGLELYHRARQSPGNLAMSPASISIALSMTWGGARGETASEMRQVMHLAGDPAAVMAAWGKLGAQLQDPARALKLRIANRLFGERSFPFEQAYLEQTKAAYGAPLEPMDFQTAAEPARARINAWVSDQTEKRIQNLLPPKSIDSDTRLVLVNAIYFLADWMRPFNKGSTVDLPFTVAPGKDKRVPTMNQRASFPLATTPGGRMLELPYKGGDTAMWILLPDKPDGLAEIEASLDASKLDAWRAGLVSRQVQLALPKFTIDPPSPLALAKELRALGMKKAFDGSQADFSGIARATDPSRRLFISNVFHKAFVKVDEKGTEAAAATAVVMSRSAAMPTPVEEFKVDHPFLFFIVDKPSGLVLFMGRVVDPS